MAFLQEYMWTSDCIPQILIPSTKLSAAALYTNSRFMLRYASWADLSMLSTSSADLLIPSASSGKLISIKNEPHSSRNVLSAVAFERQTDQFTSASSSFGLLKAKSWNVVGKWGKNCVTCTCYIDGRALHHSIKFFTLNLLSILPNIASMKDVERDKQLASSVIAWLPVWTDDSAFHVAIFNG